MSSIRRHFPHFGLQKQQSSGHHHHSGLGGGLSLSSSNKSNGTNRYVTDQANLLMADSMSGRELSKATMDTVTFKEDIFNCLEICTSYIQALNTLCSTGSVLAQNLTQVFSRDLVDVGKTSVAPYDGFHGHNKLNNNVYNPFSFLSSKSRHSYGQDGRHNSMGSNNGRLANDSDATYFEVAEQFLRMWEMMSVSTAGASATVKTETLMTLQDVINKLESADDEPGLDKCIDAAKSCLLSYIELQAQFSYNSWKALSQLSKVLKSNASMIDVVKNIKQHFSFNDTSSTSVSDATKSGSNNSSLPHGASNCQTNRQGATEAEQDNSSMGCLQDAISLLSLDKHNLQQKKSRKRNKRHHRSNRAIQYPNHQETCQFTQLHHPLLGASGHVGEKAATFDGRLKSFDKRCSIRDIADEQRLTEINIIKQSTWPGKGNLGGISSASTNAYRHTSLMNDWSMWSDASSDTAFHTPASTTPTASSGNNTLHTQHHHMQAPQQQQHHPLNSRDPFSDNFQLAWQAFTSANSDQQNSTSISTTNCPVSVSGSLF